MAKLIGTDPNQVPTNADLGDMAYKNGDNLKAGPLTVVDESVSIGGQAPTTVFDINVERPIGTTIRLYGSNNSGAQTLYESFNGKDFRVGIENSTGSLGYGSAAYDRYLFSEGSFPITFSTDSTERMRIDASGRVTMPYQPAFSFPSSTNFSVNTTGYRYMNSSNVFANVAAGTSLNVGNHFNTSNGRFTAPVDGVYEFNLTYGVILYSGYFLVYLEKNLSGSYYSIYNPTNQDGDWMLGTLNWKTFLYSGDFVTPMWNNNYTGGNLGHVKFSGHLIG